MGWVRTALKIVGGGLGLLLAMLLLAFGLAQTPPGKAWLAGALSAWLSSPTERVTIESLKGLVPLDMTVGKIEFADRQGPRLVIEDASIAIAPLDLLSRQLTLRLAARQLDLERLSQGGGTNLADLLHSGFALDLEELRIDRLHLGPDIVGQPVTMRLAASGVLGGGRAAADLDLARIDGTPGEATLHLALGGEPLSLDVAADLREPQGRLLASLLDRREAIPFDIHIAGRGPLGDWHGHVAATAGDRSSVTADIDIVQASGYRLEARGDARLAALLPARAGAVIGEDARFAATIGFGDQSIAIEDFTLGLSAGTLRAQGRLDQRSEAIAGDATVDLPDLALLGPALGVPSAGAAKATLALSGTLAAPTAHLTLAGTGLAFDGNGAARAQATIDLKPAGDPRLPATPIDIAASGRLEDVTAGSSPLPRRLGERLDWRFAGRLDRVAAHLSLSTLALEDAGNSVTAQGDVGPHDAAGTAHLALPDLAALIGETLPGSATFDVDFQARDDGAATATLKGGVHDVSSGIAALDGALGTDASLTAKLQRLADGTVSAGDVTVIGANARLTGGARRSADGVMAADIHVDLPRLAALDRALAGRAAVDATLNGPENALSGKATISADGLAVGAARLDRLEAKIELADLMKPSGRLSGEFHAPGLDGTARAEGSLIPSDVLRLPHVEISAARTTLEGSLTLHLADGIAEGTLAASVPDLAPWSKLLGTPIAGHVKAKAVFAGAREQKMDLDAEGGDLRWGAAQSSRVQKLRITASLADLLRKPTGRGELRLDGAAFGGTSIDQLRLTGATTRPGRFALTAEAKGKAIETFALAAAATMSLESGAVDARLTKLDGKFGAQPVALRQPLSLTRREREVAFADLALGLGGGEITGAGSSKGDGLSLHLLARDLPVKMLAELGGQRDVTGILGFELTVTGTRRHPQGTLIVDGERLRFAAAARPDLPALGLVASATWRGDDVDFKGRVAAPRNAALGFAGRVPLVLDARDGTPRFPATGAVALHLEGDGELAEFADLLPSGEDRLAGRFAIDVSVTGTVAAPAASGKLSLRNGRYENFATGTNLTQVSFDLVGDRERLLLQNFSAQDGRKGTLAVAGAVELAAPGGPTLNLAGEIKNFRAIQLDEATATASGTLRLGGKIVAPELAAELRIDGAELRVPEKLPRNAQPISVIEINSATGQVLSAPKSKEERPPWLAMTLDIGVAMPGQIFVRGRGLDSEWRGNLRITGTTAAPEITGKLTVIRGSFAFIGKDFVLNSGTITFLGGQKIDPQIAIEAQVSSADVVAIVRLTGSATAPKVALSSQPALPQDEILSRVLFGTSVSQISAAQGIQIAQAAAALAGGGDLGILDKIRTGLGLDRLTIGSAGTNPALPGLSPGLGVPSLSTTPGQPAGLPGSAPALGAGTSPLPPAGIGGAGSAATAAAVSAGKYVAPGVYVGVTQGLTQSTSSVNVQIDVTKHITIDTTAGGTGEGSGIGTGIGVMWKLDY